MDTLDTKHISQGTTNPQRDTSLSETPTPPAIEREQQTTRLQTFVQKWSRATLSILPIYVALHIGFFLTTCLSFLFTHGDFDGFWVKFHELANAWHRWDTGHYMSIAQHGYTDAFRSAFFPLYPLLIRALTPLTNHNPLYAALLISDIAGFFMLVVLYQLVREDFSEERANRTVLYLSLFPTAFFFAAGYTESLFLCLTLAGFYNIRRGNWWIAGIFGFFACLTRSAGVFLLLPFAYEYLRQHEWNLGHIRFDVVSGGVIAAGTGIYALYCYYKFHDVLAFSHAQAYWNHSLQVPWYGVVNSIKAINTSSGLVSFQSMRNMLDLIPDLIMLILIVLLFVGPAKFPRSLWSYGIYAAFLYIFLQVFPVGGTGLFPLQSVSRYLLELFPAFIVLAAFGKYRMVHMNYLVISGALLFFLLTQFLTGHWVL